MLAARAENVLQGGQWADVDFLGSIDDPLKGSPVHFGAAGTPRRNGVHQHTLNRATVQGHPQLFLCAVLPGDPLPVYS